MAYFQSAINRLATFDLSCAIALPYEVHERVVLREEVTRKSDEFVTVLFGALVSGSKPAWDAGLRRSRVDLHAFDGWHVG